MASGLGAYLADKILDFFAGGVSFVPAPTLYLALYAAIPGPTGGGTELSGGGYSRAVIANNLTTWNVSTNGVKTNAIQILFPGATANIGVVVGAALWDAPIGGNLYAYGTFNEARSIFNGDVPQFPIGSLSLIGVSA